MATTTEDIDAEHQASPGRRYLIRFEDGHAAAAAAVDPADHRVLGTFPLVTVAAGAG